MHFQGHLFFLQMKQKMMVLLTYVVQLQLLKKSQILSWHLWLKLQRKTQIIKWLSKPLQLPKILKVYQLITQDDNFQVYGLS